MAVTFEEAKAFIEDAKKSRENWLVMADRSWDEIKKRQKNGRLWSVAPNTLRKRARYPAWYSIFKIRQGLVFSRAGIPIGKDTTQDGNDNIGATAALCAERLAVNLAREFDFFDVMCAARDDFLITNFAEVRAYYEKEDVKEKVKKYLRTEQIEQDIVFIDEDGKIIESDNISQDDEGYFIETEQVVDVQHEKVCLEPVLYKEIFLDPDIRRFSQCKRLAFAVYFSEPEFIEMFGREAFNKLPSDEAIHKDEASPKRRSIRVFEYWDYYDRECYWFAENGEEFIKPKEYLTPDYEEYDEDGPRNGIYDLRKFFPVPDPLVSNQSTDEFWPIPEYYQLVEVFEDIHTIFSRMVTLTKAIRTRLLFDNNVDGLQQALNEAAEGDAFGVDNLARALVDAGGSLENVVQYIPVEACINGLQQLYIALEQRLNVIYKLTGTSDLLQGLITDPTQRTFGERQMTEKYSLNQIAEPQRKMAEFVRNSYQLLVEMALKNFKDESLAIYTMPQTMPPEHQQRYAAAMEMLKDNDKRFRIELETDSTITLNEQYDKQMRIELVNALTSALEKTANVAQSSPALVVPELHALKFLVQGFRQAKLFQDEITQAIQNVIDSAKNQPAPFNKDETQAKQKDAELQMRGQEVQAQLGLKQFEIQSRERIEMMKLNQESQIVAIENQLAGFKLQVEQGEKGAELQLQYAELNVQIGKMQQELALKRDELLIEMRKVSGEQELKQYQVMMEQQLKPMEQQLEAYALQIDRAELQLREQDQMLKAQEQSFQAFNTQVDNLRQEIRMKLDAAELAHEMRKPPELPPITINMPQPATTKKKIDLEYDDYGNIKAAKSSDIQEPSV